MKSKIKLTLLLTCLALQSYATPVEQKLANGLMQEQQYNSAAIEYRRLAINSEQRDTQFGYYWAAAYAYYRDHNPDLTQKMLDYAEDSDADHDNIVSLLRMETALSTHDTSTAQFYGENLKLEPVPTPLQHIAAARLTKIALLEGNTDRAATLLPTNSPAEVTSAIQQYAAGSDKNPALGGLLGTIPGLGYLYAGESANALRSLIMNALFIYGMLDTSQDESWGAFSIITFFEITWYTGSIYGGIDASHRYNQRRIQACLQTIDDHASFTPNLRKLPAISLKYQF